MPDGRKKVFISWSKSKSKLVAAVLKEYLPQVLENVDIFMSDKDIDPGERSMRTIETQLDGTSYGLLIVTEENQGESWLNFEAGALSKHVGKDSEDVPRVVPLLVDIASPSELTGPISQFQAVPLDHDGLERTLLSIAELNGSDKTVIKRRFDWAWPEIDKALQDARTIRIDLVRPKRSLDDRVDEALEILRSMQRSIPSLVDSLALSESQLDREAWRRSEAARNEALFQNAMVLADEILGRYGARVEGVGTTEDQRLVWLQVSGVDKAQAVSIQKEIARRTGRQVMIEIAKGPDDAQGQSGGDQATE